MSSSATFPAENVGPLPRNNSAMAQILGLEEVVRVQDPDIFITAGKRARYYIRPWVEEFNDTGKLVRVQKRIYLGLVTKTKKKDAEREKTRVLAIINRSQFVALQQMPFGELLDAYLKDHVRAPGHLAYSTQCKYETHIENHIRPAFGSLPLCGVDTRTIDRFLNSKTSLSFETRKDLRALLSGIFTKAEKWNLWSGKNPAAGADLGRRKPGREKRKMSTADTKRLLAALPEDVARIIRMALFCTLRISEVLGLQRQHLDFQRGLILVRQRWYRGDLDIVKTPKANRDIPMGFLADELQALVRGKAKDDFLFTVQTHYRGRAVRPKPCRDDRDINQHFLRPAAVSLGLYYEGFGFHAFRREAVTAIASEDAGQAMKVAGHASIDMTAHYTLRDQAIQEKAIRKHQRAVMDLSQIEPRKRKPPVVEIPKTLKRKEKVVGLTELESVTSTVSR